MFKETWRNKREEVFINSITSSSQFWPIRGSKYDIAKVKYMEKIICLLYRSVRNHKWCTKKKHTVTFSWNRDIRNIRNIARYRKYIWSSNYKIKWTFYSNGKYTIWMKCISRGKTRNKWIIKSIYHTIT